MRTLYLVPTRGRPANAVRLAKAWHTTAAGDETRLTFCLDDDDPELPAYEEALLDRSLDHERFGFMVGPRLRLGPTLNEYATAAQDDYDAIGFMGDDHLPRTHAWDLKLLESLRPFGVVYGNDLIQGANIPTAVLLDARIVRSTGFMVPPGLVHMYLDNFWKDLGQLLGTLVYRPDVVVEHLHPIAGKAPWDARYDEVNAGEVYASDKAKFDEFMASAPWALTLSRLRHAQASAAAA